MHSPCRLYAATRFASFLVLAFFAAHPPTEAMGPRLTLPLVFESYDGQTVRDAVPTTLALSPDGELLIAGADDHQLRIWRTTSGQPEARIAHHHTDWIRGVCFASHGKHVASVGADRLLRLTTLDLPSTTTQLELRSTSQGALLAVAFDGQADRLATVGFDDDLCLHSLKSTEPPVHLACACDETRCVQFSPDGRWLAAAGRNGTVRVWDLEARNAPHDLPTDGRRVRSLAFSPDSKHLAAAGDGPAIRLWRFDETRTSLRSGSQRGGFEEMPQELLTRPGKNHALVFLSDRTLAVGGTTGTITLWDLPSRSPVRTLRGHTGTVAALASTEQGDLLVSAAFDATVRLWDLDDLDRTATNNSDSTQR